MTKINILKWLIYILGYKTFLSFHKVFNFLQCFLQNLCQFQQQMRTKLIYAQQNSAKNIETNIDFSTSKSLNQVSHSVLLSLKCLFRYALTLYEYTDFFKRKKEFFKQNKFEFRSL